MNTVLHIKCESNVHMFIVLTVF